MAPNWENKIHVSKEIEKGKEQSDSQGNIGRQYWKTGRQLEQLLEYNTKILEYLKTTGIGGTAWVDRNKPRGKLDLNLEN